MTGLDGLHALASERAREVLQRHDDPVWMQLFVRVAYAYEEMMRDAPGAHGTALLAQSNPEVVVRLLSAWLDSGVDTSAPGLAAALADLHGRLGDASQPVPPRRSAPRRSAPSTVLEGALTSGELATRLQVTRQAINQRRSRRQLLGFRRGREFLYPLWQLGDDGALLDGLGAVLEALGPGSPESHADFLLSVHPDLAGATPLERLRAGRPGEVLAVLR